MEGKESMGAAWPGLALVVGRGAELALNGELARMVSSGDPGRVRAVVVDAGPGGAPDCAGSPHLAVPQAGPDGAAAAIAWLADEAARRAALLAEAGTADFDEYNARYPKDALPFLGCFVYGWDNDAMSRETAVTASGKRESASALLARLSDCARLGMGVEVAVKWGRAADVLGKRTLALADLVVECDAGGEPAPHGGVSLAAPLSAPEAADIVERAALGVAAQGYSPAPGRRAIAPYLESASPSGARRAKPERKQLSFALDAADYARFCRLADDAGLSKVDCLLRMMGREEVQRGGERGMHELTVCIDGREVAVSHFRGDGAAAAALFGSVGTVGSFFAALDAAGAISGDAIPQTLLEGAFLDWRDACGYTEADVPLARFRDESYDWLGRWGFWCGRRADARPSELLDAGLLDAGVCELLCEPGGQAARAMAEDAPARYFHRGPDRR